MQNPFQLKFHEPKFYEKIKVKSVIVVGEHFVEYRYNSYNENFIGLWRKVGSKFCDNPSTSLLKCSSCLSHSDSWPSLRGINKAVSYQCPGFTRAFNQYDWNVGYGNNLEEIFKILQEAYFGHN